MTRPTPTNEPSRRTLPNSRPSRILTVIGAEDSNRHVTNVTDAFVSMPESDHAEAGRVVVVPSLWAPFHHVAAVASLVAFVGTVRPDGIVFMNAPGEMTSQAREAFTDVLTAFRTGYAGPIGVHGYRGQDAGVLASLSVTVLADGAPVMPGWLAASADLATKPDLIAHAETTGANVVYGATGRLRLAGRARPAADGTVRAWLVFECGTLAADPAAGTLGFGVLETTGHTVTARPVRVGADGGFTFDGTRYTTSADARLSASL